MNAVEKIKALAAELFEQNNLLAWSLELPKKLPGSCLGLCSYPDRKIKLRLSYVELEEWALVEDTLRHEIAHAIAGVDAGHGPKWQMIAILIGANPTPKKDAATMSDSFLKTVYKLRLAVLHDDGEIELLDGYGSRRTSLEGKYPVGRRELKNKLIWVTL